MADLMQAVGLHNLDWRNLFGISLPVAEIVIRGTAMYWFLFLVFRFVVPRDVGGIGIADILILVIIADASQNAMSGDYKTITDGALLIGVLVFWNMLFDRLSYYWPAFRRFSSPATLCVVKDGKLLRRNMRREYLTEEELWAHLRKESVTSLDEIDRVYIESDGGFSVLKKKG